MNKKFVAAGMAAAMAATIAHVLPKMAIPAGRGQAMPAMVTIVAV